MDSESNKHAGAASPSAEGDPFFGRMNDPTGSAVLVGLCGDEVEFYLYICDNRIVEAKYYTNGCQDTRLCGRAAAERATGKLVMDALAINPRDIIDSLPNITEGGRHCAILAVSALYRAIADFLMKP